MGNHLDDEQMTHYVGCFKCKQKAIKRMMDGMNPTEKLEAAKRMAKVVLP